MRHACETRGRRVKWQALLARENGHSWCSGTHRHDEKALAWLGDDREWVWRLAGSVQARRQRLARLHGPVWLWRLGNGCDVRNHDADALRGLVLMRRWVCGFVSLSRRRRRGGEWLLASPALLQQCLLLAICESTSCTFVRSSHRRS